MSKIANDKICENLIFDTNINKLVPCNKQATKRWFVVHMCKTFHMCQQCYDTKKESAINFKG